MALSQSLRNVIPSLGLLNELRKIMPSEEKMPKIHCSIFEDNKGQIWFGTWEGISLYDGKTFMDVSDKEPWTK